MPSRCRKKTQARPAPRCAASASPGTRSCASGARNAARRGGAPLSTIRPRLSRHQARARGFLASELSRPAIQRSERSRPPDRGGGSRQGPLERSPRSRDSPRARSQPSTPPARPGLGRQVPRARSLDAARGTSCPGLCSDEHQEAFAHWDRARSVLIRCMVLWLGPASHTDAVGRPASRRRADVARADRLASTWRDRHCGAAEG
jgi:hypothetical protein